MALIAEQKDLPNCQELLKQLSSSNKFTCKYLYIPSNEEGFSTVVYRSKKIVGMSTFSLRSKETDQGNFKALFWENLIVDKDARNGEAYLDLILFLRRLIRNNQFQEIYLIAHRQKALRVHKSANFKEIGYVDILFSNFQLHLQQKKSRNISVITYQKFIQKLENSNSSKSSITMQ